MNRITEHSAAEVAGPANAFFAIGDPQNLRQETLVAPLTLDVIRRELHFYLLFCDHLTLIAEDMVLNEQLTSLLLSPGYRDLLANGTFIPLLRSHYDSFGDAVQYLQKPDLYNPVAREVYLPLLEQLKTQPLHVARFDEQETYENFTTIARRYLLDPDFMERFRLRPITISLSRRMDELCAEAKRTQWRRSLLFYFARELEKGGHSEHARAVRHLSSVLYCAQFCGYFNQIPAFPQWYGRYLGALTGIVKTTRGTGPERLLELNTIALENLQPQIRTQLSQLSLQNILEIRSSAPFRRYVSELERCNNALEIGEATEHSFIAALEGYVRFLDQRFGEIVSQRRGMKRKKEQLLGIVRQTTPVGVVVSLVGTAASLASGLPIGMVGGLVWSALSLSFYLYRGRLEKQVEEMDRETAKFWSAWCTPKGTFAASLARSEPNIIRRFREGDRR